MNFISFDAEVFLRDALRAARPAAVIDVTASDTYSDRATQHVVTADANPFGLLEDEYFGLDTVVTVVTTAKTLPRALDANREIAQALTETVGLEADGAKIAFARVSALPTPIGLHDPSGAPQASFTADVTIMKD